MESKFSEALVADIEMQDDQHLITKIGYINVPTFCIRSSLVRSQAF